MKIDIMFPYFKYCVQVLKKEMLMKKRNIQPAHKEKKAKQTMQSILDRFTKSTCIYLCLTSKFAL